MPARLLAFLGNIGRKKNSGIGPVPILKPSPPGTHWRRSLAWSLVPLKKITLMINLRKKIIDFIKMCCGRSTRRAVCKRGGAWLSALRRHVSQAIGLGQAVPGQRLHGAGRALAGRRQAILVIVIDIAENVIGRG